MTRPAVCVMKVGGSLLDYDRLAEELQRWLAADRRKHDARHYVLIAGGGRWANAIRQADSVHSIGDEAAHWSCVRAMSTTAALLAERIPNAQLTTDLSVLQERFAEPGQTIFGCEPFLREQEPRSAGTTLPQSWDVTSDSIAARLAIILGAEEFVLLKSAAPPADSWRDLATAGYVDPFFERLVAELPAVRIVDLRNDDFPATLMVGSCGVGDSGGPQGIA